MRSTVSLLPDLPHLYTSTSTLHHIVHGLCYANLNLMHRSHFFPRKGKLSNFSILVAEFRHEKPRPVGDKALEQMDLQLQYISSYAV